MSNHDTGGQRPRGRRLPWLNPGSPPFRQKFELDPMKVDAKPIDESGAQCRVLDAVLCWTTCRLHPPSIFQML